MSDWKNTEWQEKLKNKPFKYWIRDEIEEIVKEENIGEKYNENLRISEGALYV